MAQTIQWARLFEIAERPALPLQARLRGAVVQAIGEGRLAAGAALPSSRELAAQLGISRNTVTAAYLQLVDEGFLEARPRSGVFVAPQSLLPRAEPVEPWPRADPARARAPQWEARTRRSLLGRPTLAKPERWRESPYPF